MRVGTKSAGLVLAVSCAALCAPGCTGDDTPPDGEASWEALLTDGDPTKIAPGSMPAAGMTPPPPPTQPRFRTSSTRPISRTTCSIRG
jgi:hypothetical protein